MQKPLSKDKEFVSVQISDTLADNYARILQDTTVATQLNYHKRFRSWQVKTPADLEAFIEKLDQQWQDGEYRYATVRQYKAAIGYALSNAHQFKVNQKELNYKYREYYELSGQATTEQLEQLYQRMKAIGKTGHTPTLDKAAGYNEKTSTTKDKRFPAELLDAVMQINRKQDLVGLKTFLHLNSKLGLRPIEYQNATLLRHDIAHNPELLKSLGFSNITNTNGLKLTVSEADTTKPLLLVKNGKNTHARACGEYRLLYLDVLNNKEIDMLLGMMKSMREISESSDKSFGDSVIAPMGKQLYYILTHDKKCKAIVKGLHDEKMRSYRKQIKTIFRNKPVFKRPTLYSTRHQAVADAKAVNLNPILIAACFGHSSVFTAESHYGKMVFGSGKGCITPTQISVNEVVSRLTEAQSVPRELYDRDPSLDEPTYVPEPKPIPRPAPRF